jgi:AhpD family alkylhydroperoxidase
MLLYRPDCLTRPLLQLTADAMRGPSHWTAGDREYLAMCTAQLHQCPFCIDTHAELTRIAGHGEIDPDEPASARPELRKVREFLDTVNRNPDHVDTSGITGLPEQAVVEALHVQLVWNVVNRVANAFGFELRDGQLHVPARCTGSATGSPASSSPAATAPTTAMSWRTFVTPCVRPPRPATRSPNRGGPTPRLSATRRTR